MLRQHGKRDFADALVLPLAFRPRHSPCRDQPAQAAIGLAISRIGEEGEALDGLYPAADHRSEFQRLGLAVQPHHACHAVGIGNRNRIIAQRPGLRHKVHRLRSAAQEREAAGQPQLDKRRGFWRGAAFRIGSRPAAFGGERGFRHLNPPPKGEGDYPQDGGGAPSAWRDFERACNPARAPPPPRFARRSPSPFGGGFHPASPCKNHSGDPPRPSPARPAR